MSSRASGLTPGLTPSRALYLWPSGADGAIYEWLPLDASLPYFYPDPLVPNFTGFPRLRLSVYSSPRSTKFISLGLLNSSCTPRGTYFE